MYKTFNTLLFIIGWLIVGIGYVTLLYFVIWIFSPKYECENEWEWHPIFLSAPYFDYCSTTDKWVFKWLITVKRCMVSVSWEDRSWLYDVEEAK